MAGCQNEHIHCNEATGLPMKRYLIGGTQWLTADVYDGLLTILYRVFLKLLTREADESTVRSLRLSAGQALSSLPVIGPDWPAATGRAKAASHGLVSAGLAQLSPLFVTDRLRRREIPSGAAKMTARAGRLTNCRRRNDVSSAPTSTERIIGSYAGCRLLFCVPTSAT